MTAISTILGREILDSRGNPTVEVDVVLQGGQHGRAAVPSGASTGEHEAHRAARWRPDALRRQGRPAGGRQRQWRASATRLIGLDAADQVGLDRLMLDLDGTPNKTQLGANAILGVSMAAAHAAAAALGEPLYAISAARERDAAARADDEHHQRRRARRQPIDFQEFMIMPVGASRSPRPAHRRRGVPCAEARAEGSGHSTAVGDEGGFAPNLASTEAALDFSSSPSIERRLHPGQGRRLSPSTWPPPSST